jgi:hypothetical protein
MANLLPNNDGGYSKWNVTYFNETNQPMSLTYIGEKAWDSSSAPDSYTIPACSSYTMNTTFKFTPNGSWSNVGNSGYLYYNFHGVYTGTIQLTGNYPDWPDGDPTWQLNAQSVTGSLDWVGLGQTNAKLCNPGQRFNCIATQFTTPENINASKFSGGHGGAARYWSTPFNDSGNIASVEFKPLSESSACAISNDTLDQYVAHSFPRVFLAHRDKFWNPAKNMSYADIYQNWDTNLISGGVYTKGLLPIQYSYDPSSMQIMQDGDNATTSESAIEFNTDVILTNNTDMTQTLTTNSFSHTVTVSTTTSNTTGWDNTFGGSATVSADVNVGIPAVAGGKVTTSVEVDYHHTWSGSEESSVTRSDSYEYSAPAQQVLVPPHSQVKVNVRLYSIPFKFNYVFKGTLLNTKLLNGTFGGRYVSTRDEWLHEENYQAVDPTDIRMSKGEPFQTDLYTLLDSGYALPMNLSKDESSNTYKLLGSGVASSKFTTQFVVTVYPDQPLPGYSRKLNNIQPLKVYYVAPRVKKISKQVKADHHIGGAARLFY